MASPPSKPVLVMPWANAAAVSYVFTQSTATGAQLACLLALASVTHESDPPFRAFPGVPTLARMLHVTEGQVKRYLAELRAGGYITPDGYEKYGRAAYLIGVADVPPRVADDTGVADVPPRVADTQERGSTSASPGVAHLHRRSYKKKNKETEEETEPVSVENSQEEDAMRNPFKRSDDTQPETPTPPPPPPVDGTLWPAARRRIEFEARTSGNRDMRELHARLGEIRAAKAAGGTRLKLYVPDVALYELLHAPDVAVSLGRHLRGVSGQNIHYTVICTQDSEGHAPIARQA